MKSEKQRLRRKEAQKRGRLGGPWLGPAQADFMRNPQPDMTINHLGSGGPRSGLAVGAMREMLSAAQRMAKLGLVYAKEIKG